MLSRRLELDHSISLNGPVVLDAGGGVGVLRVHAGVNAVLTDMTVTGGSVDGGIKCEKCNLVINGGRIDNNHAELRGGGIANQIVEESELSCPARATAPGVSLL